MNNYVGLILKRTGKLIERIRAFNDAAGNIQPYHTVRPIPKAQLNAISNHLSFIRTIDLFNKWECKAS